MQAFFLPYNDELTHDVDSRNLSVKFINFDCNDFTLMQTFNSTLLSNDEIDKLLLKIPELKRVSFQHVSKVLKEIHEKYPFVVPYWLVIIIL